MKSHSKTWDADRADGLIRAHLGQEGPLLPILHALQLAFGHIPEVAIPQVALALNLSRAEVHGVVSFYHDFRGVPVGRHEVKLCRAEACQARGGRAVELAIEAALGVAMGGTTTDGGVTLTPVYCLGLCASGPAAMVDGAPIARLTPSGAADLAARLTP